ncbi:hypothetical protein UFOVP29_17 [uncultured Caudovirales phage]|uniref:Uncharacterized protein n=1 Tax=uncultured Caudovirales phage TaxID=2100421 RepID=A0A6J5KJS7_9CAUD|nr:hypothetical protein UFOVP29_17 [uncultured Caudovirales phage]
MKIYEIIEHVIVPDQTFDIPSLENGHDQGTINLNMGSQVFVYVKTHGNICQMIAHSGSEIFGFLTLVIVPNRQNLAMAKNAESYVKGKHLLLNLILWAKRQHNLRIISDYELTRDGEKAWQAMAKNIQLNVKIYNFDQDRVYDQNDPSIVRPEQDVADDPNDITWFYIIEHQNKSKFGLNESSYGATSILQPMHYADDSIPDSF